MSAHSWANKRAQNAGAPPGGRTEVRTMPTCRDCDSEVDTLKTIKVGGKSRKVCEDCADRIAEQQEIAEASEGVVQDMMGFKGRR
jgi:hypothetical protein